MSLTPPQTRLLAWVGLGVVAWWLLGLLGPVLTPFLVAAVMAYALHPWVERMHARRLPRGLAAAVAIALFMVVLLAFVLMIVPVVTRQWPLLREQIPVLLEGLNATMAPWASRLGLEAQIDVGMVRDALRRLLSGHEGEWLERVLASARIGGSAALALLGTLVLTPIVAYYLLLDWAALVVRVKSLVPLVWQPATQRFLDETDQVLGQYLRGQLLVMGILSVFYAVGLSLIGLDLAVPIGVFTGLAVFVPYVGFGLGLVLGLLAALLEFQSLAGVALVGLLYLAGQLLESLYLTPRLLGERIGLHPIAVIFALMAFGHVFGFAGVLLALPASAVLLVAIRRLQAVYMGSSLYTHGTSRAPLGAPDPLDREMP
jgi:predicted PurR-regulated permease PerM